ncbi:isoprenoid synthase domain-containing protein [Irpex rosettiformis]|uniref:Isoprenoid synthase domain-containing protein n=1 Tax=Irpex rosettiformis TaxID=378272 RepID=A0ACB8TRE6_9APHY|nr:isoprenoid synthase domain-containing protein [Irpex rosettiformis]
MPNNFQIPDLTKLCGEHFDLRVNEHCHPVGQESRQWVLQQGLTLVDEYSSSSSNARALQLASLQIPLLASLWYPTCDVTQLRTATDLLTILFYKCNHPDVLNEAAGRTALDSVVNRVRHAMNEQSSRWARFQTTLASFHTARTSGQPQSVGSLLISKRSSEIFGVAFDLQEYVEDLQVSDEVIHGQFLSDLKRNALDAVTWMKEVVEYNVKQAKGESAVNLIAVLMREKEITLQAAVNQATANAKECIQSFVRLSLGDKATSLTEDAKRYVQGLRDCIVGWAYWVYETEEYFLKNGEEVKAFGWVFLLPKDGEGEKR